jgi:hypothetical protein
MAWHHLAMSGCQCRSAPSSTDGFTGGQGELSSVVALDRSPFPTQNLVILERSEGPLYWHWLLLFCLSFRP